LGGKSDAFVNRGGEKSLSAASKGAVVILVVGEVLFDIFPQYERLGGAPFNFAYHLKQFGFPVRFISKVGYDDSGARILDRISAAGFDTTDIQREKIHPTGSVKVELDESGVPTFDIVADVAYDYITYNEYPHKALLASAEMLYFGTLVQRTDHGLDQIGQFLDRRPPGCLTFCDLNLRPGATRARSIKAALQHADVLKLNAEELRVVLHVVGIDHQAPIAIAILMKAHAIKTVALTKGDRGSELHTSQGIVKSEPQLVEKLADTVGAGDAYAAMLAAGILNGWPPQQTLDRATTFASQICAIEGAIPDAADFYASVRKLIRKRA
jgi:fructokinase